MGMLWLGLVAAGVAFAQERPQEGRDTGRLEMTRQISAGSGDSLDVQAMNSLQHEKKQRNQLMTPRQSTDAFLGLDHNHDMLLTRSELPQSMTILRAQFERYDLNHDHRLSYSEFANYTDVIPTELAQNSH